MDLKQQYDQLLRYCYMKTKDRYLAEDITQETFLKFWQSKTYEDTGKEMAYLYTIARNLCNDEFRKPQTIDIDDHPELIYEDSDSCQHIIERITIEQALDKLPDDLKEIVVLRYMNDISASDIGKILGISRFTVNRRVKEGLKLLKKQMEGEAR